MSENIGSSLDDFLEEEAILAESQLIAIKRLMRKVIDITEDTSIPNKNIGCVCGCRSNFEMTENGLKYLEKLVK